MKRQIALTFALVAGGLTLAAAPALAGKGGGSGGSTTSTPSIAIATLNGAPMNASTLSPTPAYENTVTWATTVGSLAGWESPMVALSCYQDVNGDGVIDTSGPGPDEVYGELDTPGATFSFGGYSSIWTQRGGGAAVCRADLDAIGWKSGKESVRLLATTGNFPVSG